MNKTAMMAMVITIALTTVGATTTNAFATEGSSAIACEADGYEAGQNGPFSQGLYETCKGIGAGDEYYQGFIDGCMSVEGNTRDVCESATDAD